MNSSGSAQEAATLCTHFTKERLLACLAIATELEHVATTLVAPCSKDKRVDIAWIIYDLAQQQMALLRRQQVDMPDMREHLVSMGIPRDFIAGNYLQ